MKAKRKAPVRPFLKRCPFCRHRALYHREGASGSHIIQCSYVNCGAEIWVSDYYGTKPEAFRRWNHRGETLRSDRVRR